jgi:hypothetical protein
MKSFKSVIILIQLGLVIALLLNIETKTYEGTSSAAGSVVYFFQ